MKMLNTLEFDEILRKYLLVVRYVQKANKNFLPSICIKLKSLVLINICKQICETFSYNNNGDIVVHDTHRKIFE